MRYTVIDGRSYEVRECAECPFRDMGDGGWGAHCTHPLASQDPRAPLEIAFDGKIAEGCPLRASGKWPCPFCGSFRQKEVYIDDTGEILEEWMMDEVNKGMDENDQYMTLQEFYDAAACSSSSAPSAGVISNPPSALRTHGPSGTGGSDHDRLQGGIPQSPLQEDRGA